MPDELLLGPVGLLIAALIAVGALWRDHVRSDADDRAQRDRAIALVEGLVPAVKELAEATKRTRRDDP